MSGNSRGNSAFAIGKAAAEVLGERLEDVLTATLSDMSRFGAEQQEQLQEFAREVMARAEQHQQQSRPAGGSVSDRKTDSEPVDLQATIDDLRAAIAGLRAELNAYKTRRAQ